MEGRVLLELTLNSICGSALKTMFIWNEQLHNHFDSTTTCNREDDASFIPTPRPKCPFLHTVEGSVQEKCGTLYSTMLHGKEQEK